MKILFSLLFISFCSLECHEQRSQTFDQAQYELIIAYEASTRGFYEKIWITKDSVSVSSDRDLKAKLSSKCSSEDWNDLVALVKLINVEKLSDLEAPSKMHQVDGAAMATLAIGLDNEVYETNIFDHGHPPKAISQLVKKVLSIKDMMVKH